jgi:hypothetical protein
MSFCTDSGATQVAGARFCRACGSAQQFEPTHPVVLANAGYGQVANQDADLIRRIADYERISGILWIVLGAIQILTLVGIIAGIWNIFAGRSRLKLSPFISARDASVPEAYESMSGLVIIGVINVLVGGFIGVAFIAFDFYIRDLVLSNARLFNQTHSALASR